MHKYTVIIRWSGEDGVFVAEAPELPGCVAHGETQEAALASVGDAVDLWVATAQEFGDAVPAPGGRGRRQGYAASVVEAGRYRCAFS